MLSLFLAIALLLPVPPLGPTLGSSHVTMTQLPATGLATYYSDGLFPQVVRNQIRNGNIQPNACPECLGYAAMLWPGDLGRAVCVNDYGPLEVVDSAAGHHRQSLIDKGWVIDLQWNVWQELGFPNDEVLVTVTDC